MAAVTNIKAACVQQRWTMERTIPNKDTMTVNPHKTKRLWTDCKPAVTTHTICFIIYLYLFTLFWPPPLILISVICVYSILPSLFILSFFSFVIRIRELLIVRCTWIEVVFHLGSKWLYFALMYRCTNIYNKIHSLFIYLWSKPPCPSITVL